GYGHAMLSTAHFKRAGGWPEHRSWGKEDDDFFARINAVTSVAREEVPGFYHQWHPDDIAWKDRYSEQAAFAELERRQVQAAKQELQRLVPKGATIILVD